MKNINYITAGAGSGKTFTLTQKLLEFISKGVKANQVILTTFTKLAASEFKEKAREKLLEEGLFTEAVELESAQIGTVDSIANNFVSKYWYLLGRGAKSNVLSETDRKVYVKQSLSEVVTKADLETLSKLIIEFGYQRSYPSTSDDNMLEQHLEKIINFAQQYNITDFSLSREKSCELVDSVFSTPSKFDIKEDLIEFLNNFIASKKKPTKDTRDAVRIIAIFNQSDGAKYSEMLEAFKSVKKLKESEDICNKLNIVLQSKKYGELLKTYVNRVFDISEKWIIGDREYKRQNNILDYGDMECLFLQLLDIQEVRDEIAQNYKVVFVDEFQDSSPLQIQCFDKLSEIVQQSIWVGDSKQAIYGFRGSDMSLVSAVSDKFSPDGGADNLVECEPLKNSWRSRKPLVEFSNDLFAPLFNHLREAQVILQPARAKDENQFDSSAIMHWQLNEKNKQLRNKALAQRVSKLLDSKLRVIDKQSKAMREIIPNDIAILCRSNGQVDKVASELRSAGLKVNCADTSGDVIEVVLFKAIFSYLLNYRNDIAKATILYLTNANMDIESLLSSRFDFLDIYEKDKAAKWATDNEFVSRIDEFRDNLTSQSLPELIENVVLKLDLLSFIKHYPNFEARKGNITRLMSKAKSYDDRCLSMGIGSSLLGFLQFLEEGESEKIITKYSDAVNVLTYHKSKGLEWNVVIMDDLNNPVSESWKNMFGVKAIPVSEPTAANLYPERYLQLLPNILSTSKTTLPDGIKDCIEQMPVAVSLNEYALQEAKRLLYVGVTRARDYLVLTSEKDEAKSEWLKNIGSTVDFFTYKACEIPCEQIVVDDDYKLEHKLEILQIAQKQLCDNDAEPRYISPSKLHNHQNVTLGEPIDLGVKINVPENSDMQLFGVKLHQAFCLYPSGSEVDITMDALYDYITNRYSKAIKIYKEAPISAKINGQIIRGEIDLIWQTQQGYVVIDYKSFPGDIENIMDKESSHFAGKYAPQLKTYKSLLEMQGKKVLATLIYYAVQGVVVEIE